MKKTVRCSIGEAAYFAGSLAAGTQMSRITVLRVSGTRVGVEMRRVRHLSTLQLKEAEKL